MEENNYSTSRVERIDPNIVYQYDKPKKAKPNTNPNTQLVRIGIGFMAGRKLGRSIVRRIPGAR